MRDVLIDELRCAQASLREGSYVDALETCQSILASNANCLLAHRIAALSAVQLSRVDEAIAGFQACALLDPEDDVAHVGLALCADTQGDGQTALAELCRALELAPADPWIAGEVERRRGQPYHTPLMEARLASAGGNPVRTLMLLAEIDSSSDIVVDLTRARAMWDLGQVEAVWDLCWRLSRVYPLCVRALLWLRSAGEIVEKPLYARMVGRTLAQITLGLESSTGGLVGAPAAQPA